MYRFFEIVVVGPVVRNKIVAGNLFRALPKPGRHRLVVQVALANNCDSITVFEVLATGRT